MLHLGFPKLRPFVFIMCVLRWACVAATPLTTRGLAADLSPQHAAARVELVFSWRRLLCFAFLFPGDFFMTCVLRWTWVEILPLTTRGLVADLSPHLDISRVCVGLFFARLAMHDVV